MSEPTSMQEYHKRFAKNEKIEGVGIGNVFVTCPCPFCAAPNFMRWELLDVRNVLSAGAVCVECRRGSKAIVIEQAGALSFEFVQTSGPDQPEWLIPKMRRMM